MPYGQMNRRGLKYEGLGEVDSPCALSFIEIIPIWVEAN